MYCISMLYSIVKKGGGGHSGGGSHGGGGRHGGSGRRTWRSPFHGYYYHPPQHFFYRRKYTQGLFYISYFK